MMTINAKKTMCAVLFACAAGIAHADECNFTANADELSFGFTGYGFPDRSYVVENNTFSEYDVESTDGQLLNGSIHINGQSVDTSADKRNWDRSGEWPDATVSIRNSNIANGLFANFTDGGKIDATITAISADSLELTVSMNGVTNVTTMTYTVEDGVLSAQGKIDIADFAIEDAFKAFSALCTAAWHRGKTWTDADIYFTVPVSEPGC